MTIVQGVLDRVKSFVLDAKEVVTSRQVNPAMWTLDLKKEHSVPLPLIYSGLCYCTVWA